VTNFIRRTVTGAFIVICVLGGMWLHPVSFFIVVAVIIAGTQYEYYMMVRGTGVRPQAIAGITAGLAIYLISTAVAAGWLPGKSFLFLIPVATVVMVTELFRKVERPFDSLAHTFFSILYTAAPFSLLPFAAFGHTGLEPLIRMNGVGFSPAIPVGFFILLWTNDSGAYLVGSTIGKHRLFERISPKKSWEGFFGGLLLTMLVARLIGGWLGVADNGEWMVIAAIISIAGTAGDLLESLLKRSLELKDSGTFLPGHGGFLDRFDSVVVSFPLVYLYLAISG
jgi:phosphatidate cytidylyltransferase